MDGAVGRLKRGQAVSHEVEPGTHDVKVLFAKTGWQVPNPKTSPTMTYTVQDSETLVLNVSLGPANSPGMTAPTEEDWLSLIAEGESGRKQTSQRSTSAIVRALLAVIVLGSFVMSLVFHPGSAVHTVSQVVGGASAAAQAAATARPTAPCMWTSRRPARTRWPAGAPPCNSTRPTHRSAKPCGTTGPGGERPAAGSATPSRSRPGREASVSRTGQVGVRAGVCPTWPVMPTRPPATATAPSRVGRGRRSQAMNPATSSNRAWLTVHDDSR